ncbi:MAG: caspase family protein [Myxococcales bacterium]|nr:caspase family protein [Myxococcales bacterium]
MFGARVTALLLVGFSAYAPWARGGDVRLAVLAGNNRGGDERPVLSYAGSDARRLGEVLTRLGGFPADGVTVLEDRSRGEFLSALNEANRRLRGAPSGEKSLLLLYFSGHSDGERVFLGDEALSLAELRTLLNGSPATVVVAILDACNSGAWIRAKGGTLRPPFLQLDDFSRTRGRIVLTSAAQGELAQESDDIGGSFFTHFLLSGLLGDADEDGNRRVSLHELYAYVYQQTVHRTVDTLAGTQHPAFSYELSGEGSLVLSELDSGGSGILLAAAESGTFLVFDHKRRRVVAEIHKEPGERRLVPLPAGEYLLKKRLVAGLLQARVRVDDGLFREVDTAAMEFSPFEDPAVKGWDLLLSEKRSPLALYAAGGVLAFGIAPAGGAWWLPLAGARLVFHGWPARRWGVEADFLAGGTPQSLPLPERRAQFTLVGVSASGGVFREFSLGPLSARAGASSGLLYLERRFDSTGYGGADRTLGADLAAQVGGQIRLGGFMLGLRLSAGAYLFPFADRVVAPFIFGGLEAGWGLLD